MIPVVGVDVGGTKLEAMAAWMGTDESMEVVARHRRPTERERGYDAIVQDIVTLVREVAATLQTPWSQVAVGLGVPGAVTRRTGVVKNSNTTCLNGRSLREDVGAALEKRVAFDNDANCFALAEARLGAGRPHRDGVVFGVILGTGVGGGLVLRGELWPGPQDIAGEWGHHAVFHGQGAACYCGNRGCLEMFASGPAVERTYKERTGVHRSLVEIAARREKDSHAEAAIELLLEAFGRGLANVVDILDPSVVVLGGGVSNLDLLYTEGVARVAKYVFNDELLTPIVRHELGDSAGVFGAALLARSGLES